MLEKDLISCGVKGNGTECTCDRHLERESFVNEMGRRLMLVISV